MGGVLPGGSQQRRRTAAIGSNSRFRTNNRCRGRSPCHSNRGSRSHPCSNRCPSDSPCRGRTACRSNAGAGAVPTATGVLRTFLVVIAQLFAASVGASPVPAAAFALVAILVVAALGTETMLTRVTADQTRTTIELIATVGDHHCAVDDQATRIAEAWTAFVIRTQVPFRQISHSSQSA